MGLLRLANRPIGRAPAVSSFFKIVELFMIAIIGLGYVGLPLGLQFARKGSKVLGLDIDQAKIASIMSGKSYIHHISSEEIERAVQAGLFRASIDFSLVSECDQIIICVPTPLNRNREPDLSFVLNTGRSIAPFLKKRDVPQLVVLESTTFPGTTDEDLRKVLEEGSGLVAGVDFHLAFSPEREDPGNPNSKVSKIPKVVGGLTPTCLELAVDLYKRAVDSVVPVKNCRVAEATKLLENIFRSVNIALVNELKVVYEKMGIDIWDVIEAAKTKPFGFMPFYPGPGLGGHCIPIDPFYLTWKAREYGQSTRFIELAGEINTSMPQYVVNRLFHALNAKRLPINGSKVLIVGMAYKANVDDDRESPAYILLDLLSEAGAIVDYYDPFVPEIRPSREHAHWAGKRSVEFTQASIGSYDAAIICTAHDCVEYDKLVMWSQLIVDTRNATKTMQPNSKIVKA